MRLVLLGPPGAGKGTQAAALRERLGVPHVSTGAMLREAIAAGSPVGRKAKGLVEAGNLVPDDMIAEMVRERLSRGDAANGFMLDGYPRNLRQGETLDEILVAMGRSLECVLYLSLPDGEIVRRLSGRRTCGACGAPYHVTAAPPNREGSCDVCRGGLEQRPDDREEVVHQRLKVYREMTEPLVAFYRRRGILREIVATGTVEEVRKRLVETVESVGGRA